jgi:hypothetical protein
MRTDQDQIREIVEDAICAGLISTTLAEFEEALDQRTPAQQEEYLQALWDEL